jgi:hypothetical protein
VDEDLGKGSAEIPEFKNAKNFRIREGQGELFVHSLLPRNRIVTRRGGPGSDFYTPGNETGGDWGSGTNWPLEPSEGGPLPDDPKLVKMWKAFWGEDFSRISPSNRKNVVPGAWRIEVSPTDEAEEDLFLHVFEIGDIGETGKSSVELVEGLNFVGAVSQNGPAVLFATSDSARKSGELSLPDISLTSLTISSLEANALYELSFYGPNIPASQKAALPGLRTGTRRERANDKGLLYLEGVFQGNSRVRIALV